MKKIFSIFVLLFGMSTLTMAQSPLTTSDTDDVQAAKIFAKELCETNHLPEDQWPCTGNKGSKIINVIIDDRHVSSIPSSIGNVKTIVWIKASYNDLESIPASIGNLKNLKYLDINGNHISSIPASIGNLNLSRLIIDRNLENDPVVKKLKNKGAAVKVAN